MSTFDPHKWTGLPFYLNIEKQAWREEKRKGNFDFGIFHSPIDKVIPAIVNRLMKIQALTEFVLCIPNDFNDPSDVTYCEHSDILSDIDSSDIVIKSRDNIDDVLILGNKVLVTNLPVTGVYFFRITDGTDTWYSELFQTSGYEIAGNLEFSPISSKPGQGGVEVNTPTINI